jgi:hypothetical protein
LTRALVVGAVQETTTVLLDVFETLGLLGAPGSAAGIAPLDLPEDVPVPLRFVAVTVKR